MRKGIKPPATVLFMSFVFVSLLSTGCLPPSQTPVSQAELQEIVRAEVSSQIALIALGGRNGPRDLDALRAEFELAVMEPLNDLQGELVELRNEFFGGDYASKLDLEGLRLELERTKSLFDSLEFEFARRDQLDELRMEIDNVRFSAGPQAEIDLRSDLDQFNIEFQSMRNEFESLGRHFELELEQLQLETEGVRRLIENLEETLRIETDSLHRRIDAVR